MDIFEKLADQLRGQDKTIVFPEGEDPRVRGSNSPEEGSIG